MSEPIQNSDAKNVSEKIAFFEKKAYKAGSSKSTIKKTNVQAKEKLGKTEQIKPKSLKERTIAPADSQKTQPKKMRLSQEKKQTRAKSGSHVDKMKERFERTRGYEIKHVKKEARPLSNELNLLERFSPDSPLFRAKAVDLAKKLIVLRLKARGDAELLDSLEQKLNERLKNNKALQEEIDKLQFGGNSLKAFGLSIEEGENFDTLVSKVLDDYGVKSQDIPGPNKEQAQLTMLNRIAISEEESYPTDLIIACEKAFRQNTGKKTAPVKLDLESYRFKIIPYPERGKLLVEIKEIGKGAFASGTFKKIKYAAIYGESGAFAAFVTAKPKAKASVKTDTKKTEDGKPADSPDAERIDQEIQVDSSIDDSSEAGGSMIVHDAEEPSDSGLPEELKFEDDLSFETSAMPINRMNLQMLEREKGRIDDELRNEPKDEKLKIRLQNVKEKISERKEGMKKIETIKTPSEKEAYENEIKMQKLFKGEGVQSIHKVVSLQDGRKIMVQEMAGYQTDDGDINDLAAFSEIKSKRKLKAKEKKVLYQALYDSFKGLERMHRKGYIHRDVKPENTLISIEGKGLVSDFGTAIAEDDPQKFIRAGTPQYQPPEAVNWTGSDMWSEINAKWDVWSVGLMMTDLALEEKDITDHPIFLNQKGDKAGIRGVKNIDTFMSRLQSPNGQKQYNERLQKFRESNPDNPIVELIIKCTQIDPDERPTMTEVKEEFEKIIEKQDITLE